MMHRRRFIGLAVGCCAPILARGASAQTYPSRPITLIVPYAAGGSADALPRIVAERMRTALGQPVAIENVTGGAGSIGTTRLARSAPDGYTIGLGTWSTHVANGAISTLQYDPLNDFEPIALIASSPLLIAARKSLPAQTLAEIIAWLRANPDAATQGTNGPGSVMHVAGLFLQRETGTRFGFVPYRGASLAMQDLVAGRIDMFIALAAEILPQARAGTIRAYAVAAHERLAAAPEIPTVDETGVPGLHIAAWFGLWAPKGTPGHVTARLAEAVSDALAQPAVRSRLTGDLHLEIPPLERQTPEALARHQKAEIDKWWPIIKSANIKAD